MITKREKSEWKKLCSQASLPELQCLVDELHRRRKENGLDWADYALQTRLKGLIHSVHRHGNLDQKEGKVNHGLLKLLKEASTQLEIHRPTGILRELLRNLSASWPQLITMFLALLTMPGMDQLMGKDLFKAEDYLRFNRFLYFLFLARLTRSQNERPQLGRFMFDDGQIKGMIGKESQLSRAYSQLRTSSGNDWIRQIPLLPVSSGQWLLSPELLYDHLLENYAAVMDAYAQRGKGLRLNSS